MAGLRDRQEEQQKRFAEFVERDPRPIIEADREGRITFSNAAARDRFPDLATRGSAHELLADWPNFVLALSRESGRPHIRSTAIAGRLYESWIHLSPDGTRVRLHVHDVTQREKELETVRRFEVVAHRVSEFMTLINRDYVYLAANDAYCVAHKLSRDTLVGRTVAQVWGEQVFRTVIKGHLDRCLAGEEVEHQLWIDFPGLGRRHVDVRYLPSRDPRDDSPLAVVVTRDITKILEQEEQLRRRAIREAISRMAAGMARQMSSPVGAVQNLALANHTDAASAVQRLRELLEGLKTFGDAPKNVPAPFELKTVIANAVASVTADVPASIRFVQESGNIPMLTGDAGSVENILKRLLVNAAHAIPATKSRHVRVTIESWQEGDRIKIAVSDPGPSIPDHLREMIFEPFFDGVAERPSFGLAVCRNLVEQMGGTLELPPKPGEGAQFVLTLPTRVDSGASVHPSHGDATLVRPRRRANLVVIDDDPTVGSTLRTLFADEHDVISFTNGHDVLAYLDKIPPVDLIFCDLMMPGFSGVEVFQAIEQKHPEFAARVIFLTGGLTSPPVERFLATTANRRCGKPLGAAAVKQLVQEILSA